VTYLRFSHSETDVIKGTLIEKDRLSVVKEGLLGFLSEKVINLAGKHYYDGSPIEKLA
jgi:hypothetical protein